MDEGAIAADGGAELEADHREGAQAVLENEFAEKDFAKFGNDKTVTNLLDAGTRSLHGLHERAKEDSVGLWLLDGIAGSKRILRYFPEFRVFIKLFPYSVEGFQAFEEVEVELDIHGTAGNAQVFEFATDKSDFGFIVFGWMAGREAGDNAVGGDDIENVEAFGDGGDKRGVAASFFVFASGNVRISLAASDEVLEAEIIDTRMTVPAVG